MIELKVHCDCGQKYKFEVEPVNNQMPFVVACPICQRDGTAKANAMLEQMAIFKPVESAPPPIAPAPTPVAAAPGRLRINVAAPAQAHAAAAVGTAPPTIAPAGLALPPTSGRSRLGAAAAETEPAKKPSFGLGILGGFLGALVGSLLFFAIYKMTGVRLFLALGVGALAGIAAQWLGRGEGSKELGGIVVVFVIVGVLAAQYFVLLGKWHALLDLGYTESVKEAKQVVKSIPTGSDTEIRNYLARRNSEDGEKVKPGDITDDEVKDFRDRELPDYRALADGSMTKEKYLTLGGADPTKVKNFEKTEQDTFKAYFILETLSWRRIILLVVAAGLAFKLCTNA